MAPRHVLLTGATGFVGSLVLALLLRRSDVGRVTCLVRKRAGSVATRLRRVMSGPAFGSLSAEVRARAVAVEGDLTADALGLDPEVRRGLRGQITDVMSVAASVRFDMPGPDAVAVNVDGPLRVLELAEEVGAGRMVHVSTAYVHPPGPGPHRAELIALPDRPEVLVEEVRRAAEPVMERLGYPNSYTLTKCLAERRLVDSARSIRIQLVRPSIVSGAWQWPEPGWVASSSALPGVQACIGAGLYKLGIGDPDVRVDVVPVDVVARRIVEALDQETAIVHAVAGTANSARTVDIVRLAHQAMAVRNYTGLPDGVVVQRPGVRGRLASKALNHAPLVLAEQIARLRGDARGRRFARQGREILRGMERDFLPFQTNEWTFTGSDLPPSFDRYAYHQTCAAGVRRWMLRQDTREVGVMGGRKADSDLRWLAQKSRMSAWHRGSGLVLRRLGRACLDRVTVDADSLEAALAEVPDGHAILFCPNHRSALDAWLVRYALQSLPGFDLPAPQIVFIEGRRSPHGGLLEPDLGVLRRLQGTRQPSCLVPLGLTYDAIPELEDPATLDGVSAARWLQQVSRGQVALGRVHLRAAAPLRLALDDVAEEVGPRLLGRIQGSLATTRRHLDAFAAHTGVSADALADLLRKRGAQVLTSPLKTEASPPAERWMRSHWIHHLAPELRSLAEGDAALEDHLDRTLWTAPTPGCMSVGEPVALAAARAHLAEVKKAAGSRTQHAPSRRDHGQAGGAHRPA